MTSFSLFIRTNILWPLCSSSFTIITLDRVSWFRNYFSDFTLFISILLIDIRIPRMTVQSSLEWYLCPSCRRTSNLYYYHLHSIHSCFRIICTKNATSFFMTIVDSSLRVAPISYSIGSFMCFVIHRILKSFLHNTTFLNYQIFVAGFRYV